MIRKQYIFILFVVLALPVYSNAQSSDLGGAVLPPGTEEVLDEIERTMYPPWVYEVTVEPENPKPGEPVTITAEIYNDPEKVQDETLEAYLFYSTDEGESWEEVEMDDIGGARLWMAELPAFDDGDEVWYGFRAYDATGNVFTDTPCYVTSWPPKDDTCMFEMAVDEPPVDDYEKIVPDDFDFTSLKAGVDSDNLYVELAVQGNIEPGSLSPVYLHLYGIAVANLDKGSPSDIVSQGFIGIYAPLANVAAFDSCMTVSQPYNEVLITNEYIQCEFEDDRLWLKISNEQVGKTEPQGHLKLIAANGAVTSLTPLSGIYYDYTHVTSVSLAARSFLVE